MRLLRRQASHPDNVTEWDFVTDEQVANLSEGFCVDVEVHARNQLSAVLERTWDGWGRCNLGWDWRLVPEDEHPDSCLCDAHSVEELMRRTSGEDGGG